LPRDVMRLHASVLHASTSQLRADVLAHLRLDSFFVYSTDMRLRDFSMPAPKLRLRAIDSFCMASGTLGEASILMSSRSSFAFKAYAALSDSLCTSWRRRIGVFHTVSLIYCADQDNDRLVLR
jgi:hypothetical protein